MSARLLHNVRLLLPALSEEAAGSLRSLAAMFIVRRSRSATRWVARNRFVGVASRLYSVSSNGLNSYAEACLPVAKTGPRRVPLCRPLDPAREATA